MSCKIDYDILNDFAEKNLDELSTLIIEEHSKTCGQCRETIKEIIALNSFLSDVIKDEVIIPDELKKIKIEILSKLKNSKGVLINITLLGTKIKLRRESMNNYINSYPGVKTGRKAASFVADEIIKGLSVLSSKAVKSGYQAILKKRYI